MRRRAARIATVLACAVALSVGGGCVSRRAPTTLPTADGEVALYRVRGEIDGRKRRFRLMLFAGLPDAIHAEVIAPVGGTVLILDGHEHRVSVAFVRERTAYVGDASSDAARYLLGFELGAAELVDAVLGGTTPPGIEIERDGEPGRYPDRLVLRSDRARLEMELRRVQSLPAGSRLGLAEPPAGFELRPLDELDAVEAVPELEAPHPSRG